MMGIQPVVVLPSLYEERAIGFLIDELNLQVPFNMDVVDGGSSDSVLAKP